MSDRITRSDGVEVMNVTVRLPKELVRDLRIIAANNLVSLRAVVESACRQIVAQQGTRSNDG